MYKRCRGKDSATLGLPAAESPPACSRIVSGILHAGPR